MRRYRSATALCAVLALTAIHPPRGLGAQQLWRLQPQPQVSIGDGPGDGHELYQVADATVAPDGRILLLDGGSHTVRIYGPQGRLLKSVGGKGDGPGEYQSLRTLRLLASGDLLVYDLVSQRVTRLTPDLDVAHTTRVGHDVGVTIPVRSHLRPLASGAALRAGGNIGVPEAVRRPEGLHQDDVAIFVTDGSEDRRIVVRRAPPSFKVTTGNQSLSPPVPFEATLLFTGSPTGVVVGSSHGTTFEALDARGQEEGTFIAEGTPRPVTSEDWDLFQAEFRRVRSQGIMIRGMMAVPGENVDKFLARTPRGKEFPLFDALLVDQMGRLWVREYGLAGDLARWQVLEAGRGVVGRIDMPRAWTLLEAGDDFVLVRERDELDVELVRKYGIAR